MLKNNELTEHLVCINQSHHYCGFDKKDLVLFYFKPNNLKNNYNNFLVANYLILFYLKLFEII